MSSGVEFEEDGFAKNYSQARPNSGISSYGNSQIGYSNIEERGMTGWLIKHHLAKSANGAQLYLIGLIIINIIITVIAVMYLL